jgi:UDP-sulfoquinovose synthase
MGEYGTPNVPIPEGFFTIEYRGRTDTLPFPRQAGSWYHQSKVHDSNNIALACQLWGLSSTDLMQGVVYGTQTDETAADPRLCTRFDFDETFGTVVNRFCAQAVIGHPLTPYGTGNQTRGFINIVDSLRCIELAILNPPDAGEYRVFNQFTETFSVNEVAEAVQAAAARVGLVTDVIHPSNPRVEAEEHFYQVDHQRLLDLGLAPHPMSEALVGMLRDLLAQKARIQSRRNTIFPRTPWHGLPDATPRRPAPPSHAPVGDRRRQ